RRCAARARRSPASARSATRPTRPTRTRRSRTSRTRCARRASATRTSPAPRPCELLGVGGARHDPPAAPLGELHGAGGARVERVVLADADAVAGLKAGAALAHDDLAAGDDLAGEDLHAEALRVGVAAVAGGAEALLVCHYSSPS